MQQLNNKLLWFKSNKCWGCEAKPPPVFAMKFVSWYDMILCAFVCMFGCWAPHHNTWPPCSSPLKDVTGICHLLSGLSHPFPRKRVFATGHIAFPRNIFKCIRGGSTAVLQSLWCLLIPGKCNSTTWPRHWKTFVLTLIAENSFYPENNVFLYSLDLPLRACFGWATLRTPNPCVAVSNTCHGAIAATGFLPPQVRMSGRNETVFDLRPQNVTLHF